MNKSKFAALVVALAGLAAALPAAAQSFYIGGQIGHSEIQTGACQGAVLCDRRDQSWSGNIGYMFSKNWGMEASYQHLGKVLETDDGMGNTTQAKTNLGDLVVVGALPIEKFSVYVKGGGYYAKTKLTSSGFIPDATSTSKQWTYGGGVRYDLWRHLAVRAEWQNYKKVGGKDVGFRGDVAVTTVGLLLVF
jgi:opacity protein-like surface antigen